jgi:hypothetical protein
VVDVQPYRVGGRSGDAGGRSVVSGAKQTAPRLMATAHWSPTIVPAAASLSPTSPGLSLHVFTRWTVVGRPVGCWSTASLHTRRWELGGREQAATQIYRGRDIPGTLGPPQIREFPIPIRSCWGRLPVYFIDRVSIPISDFLFSPLPSRILSSIFIPSNHLILFLSFFLVALIVSFEPVLHTSLPALIITAAMRFSLALAALPALAVAQENPFEQYKAQFQNFLGQMGSYIPNPAAHDPVAALESKLGQLKLNILTLENWKDTFYESISPDTTKPEEWWVLTTGRNKTCYGMFAASLLFIVLMGNGSCLAVAAWPSPHSALCASASALMACAAPPRHKTESIN